MPTARLEPTIPESERLQTYALDGAASGIGAASVGNKSMCLKHYPSSFIFSLKVNRLIFLIENTILK
jgi:hypothetical protein